MPWTWNVHLITLLQQPFGHQTSYLSAGRYHVFPTPLSNSTQIRLTVRTIHRHVFAVFTVVKTPTIVRTVNYWCLIARALHVVQPDRPSSWSVTISNYGSVFPDIKYNVTCVFTRYSIYAIARICYRPSVRPSVCLSVTRVDHTKTVEVRIMKLSPYRSPIFLVFAG